MVEKFQRNEVIVNVELKFEKSGFPAVTLCNLNPYKFSLVQEVGEIRKSLDVFEKAMSKGGESKLEAENENPEEIVTNLRQKRKARENQHTVVYAYCTCNQDTSECTALDAGLTPTGQVEICICAHHRSGGKDVNYPCFLPAHWEWDRCVKCSFMNLCIERLGMKTTKKTTTTTTTTTTTPATTTPATTTLATTTPATTTPATPTPATTTPAASMPRTTTRKEDRADAPNDTRMSDSLDGPEVTNYTNPTSSVLPLTRNQSANSLAADKTNYTSMRDPLYGREVANETEPPFSTQHNMTNQSENSLVHFDKKSNNGNITVRSNTYTLYKQRARNESNATQKTDIDAQSSRTKHSSSQQRTASSISATNSKQSFSPAGTTRESKSAESNSLTNQAVMPLTTTTEADGANKETLNNLIDLKTTESERKTAENPSPASTYLAQSTTLVTVSSYSQKSQPEIETRETLPNNSPDTETTAMPFSDQDNSSKNDNHSHFREAHNSFFDLLINSTAYPALVRHKRQMPRGSSCMCAVKFISTFCVNMLGDTIENYWEKTPPTTTTVQTTTEDVKLVEASGYGNMTDSVAITTKAKENILFTMAAIPIDRRITLSYELDEFVRKCSFNSKQCMIKNDFKLHVDPVYGNCYVFNFDPSQNKSSSRELTYMDAKEWILLKMFGITPVFAELSNQGLVAFALC